MTRWRKCTSLHSRCRVPSQFWRSLFIEELDEDQGLQKRFPALAKRDRRESGEKLHFPALRANFRRLVVRAAFRARWPTVLRRRGLLPESSRTGARWPTVLRHRGLLPPKDLEVVVASPSCKRVASKSAGYDCVNNATVPQGRLRHQRACSAGYDCVNNAPVPQGRLRNQRNVAQKPWGGPPSCDPAPLTTSLRGLWVSGNAGTGQWLLRSEGAATQKPTERHKGRRPQNRPTKGGTL